MSPLSPAPTATPAMPAMPAVPAATAAPAPEDVYVLSPMQQGLLFHSLYAPDESFYVDQFLIELAGAVDPAVLAAAWRLVVGRHPALRTSFHWQGLDKPLQVVHRQIEVPFAIHEAQRAPRRELDGFLEEIRRRGFDLGKPPLLRLDWVPTGDASGLLAWTYHHILLDAWSASVVLGEVMASYQALSRGALPDLPAAPRFATYVQWLRRRDPAADEAFWRSRLAGFRAPTPLGVDRATASGHGTPPARHGEREVVLDAAAAASLRAFARRHRLTLNSLVQGAWAALLHRYSGEPDVVFGATVAGRPEEIPGIGTMVGLFINTLPIRSRRAEGGETVVWLQELQAWQSDAQEHAHTPLADVQRWSDVAAGRPLFESIVVFENVPEMAGGAAGAAGGPADVALRGTRYVSRTHYPLSLLIEPGEQLAMRATFERGRLEETAVARLLGHLAALLAGLLVEPAPIGSLSFLSAAERHQVVHEWAGRPAATAPGVAGAERLHALFARQVQASPAAPALIDGESILSYSQLGRRAAALAARLRTLGVGPEVPVVVAVERSAAAIVALLGVLAADGVYVPVEPGGPAQRLAFVLADTGTPVAICGAGVELPPAVSRVDPAAFGEVEDDGDSFPAPRALPESLAYAIYTSGSTGRPKGVGVPHGVAAAHFAAVAGEYGIAPGERVLQFTSFAFDAGLEQVFTALLSGATLVLRGEEAWDTADLAARLGRLRIAVANLPSSYWAAWAGSLAGAESPADLRLLIAGGEAMPAAALAAWQASALSGVRLLNAYGPTEAVVTATLCDVAEAPPEGLAAPPLGRPLPGRTAYVLDAGLAPLPAGVPGELCLGGRLARGYLGRPELTAASFVPDPFGEEPGARLYRSGDRVRALPDGRLEFLGRIDRQLKVRGFRIEPGEVEAALSLHPAVAEAAVVAGESAEGPVLVAYVVPRPGGSPAAAELRRFLRARLPTAWVPAAFAALDDPPRTPGGKLDRGALPAWDGAAGRRSARAAYQGPRNAVEELLADLWSAVLGVPAVGVHDDFLELGGHSLLAMRLLSRVREAFRVDLPLAGLFEAPTVAGQAERVLAALAGGRAAPAAPAEPPLVPLPREPLEPPPLSFAQQRLWILDQFDPGLPAYNIPLALLLDGALSPAALAAALTALAARHEALRTTFEVVDGSPVQRIAAPGRRPLPAVDLRLLPPSRRRAELLELARQEAVRRFDLGCGPLLRASLVLSGAAEQALLLTVHHVVADGWSMGILLAELAELYAAASAGRAADLPPLAIQYADYAVWQRGWLRGEVLARQLAFWRERLDGLPAGTPLPIDRPRPPLQSFRGARLPFAVDAGRAAAVRALARAERATLFMTLLAALQELVARYTERADFAIGTPVANRGRLETEGLIGFFANTLALRADLAGSPTVRQSIARAREATIAATAHQDVPFEKLVEELRPERSLALTPFFQVMLTVETPLPPPPLAGLVPRPIAVESGAAKFDLTFALSELGPGDGPGLAGALEHNTDLFDAATAERLSGHFASLLAAFAAHPERPVAGVPWLAESELHQLVFEWNDTCQTTEEALPIHRRFERQAAATPNAVALTCGGDSLLYRELDRRAARLARRLAALGAGPEVPVGVFLERAPELVVALLAVWKAGALYVPLDPAYPSERLAVTLEDCGAPLVLTEEWLVDRLPSTPARPVLVGACEEGAADDDGEAFPSVSPPLDGAAYLIYTSGSTGRPKGVTITHHNAGALLSWALRRYPAAELAAVFASTSICFDLSVFEIFVPLAAGGRVHLADSGLDLLALDDALRITLVNTVPSVMAELAGQPLPASVRTLNLAGEPVPRDLAWRLAASSGLRAWNLYGPSEATTYSTAAEMTVADLEAGRPVPIGRPIDGTAAYLLDRELAPVAIGAPGELCLGGLGIARGYWGRPDLTAASFVPNPLGEAGSRLYRTGDLARAWGDGRLEFLGRRDAQVKVRGFRIEPGEVEAALARHPAVARAAVVVRQEGEGPGADRRLVAYVVPRDGRDVEAAELRTFLRRTLPDFMVPAAYVTLAELPLLPNGKVSRAALPAPAAAHPAASYVEPRSDLERTIARVLCEVLRVERVGLDDNFFDLGGHSLLMIRAAGTLEQLLGRKLRVLELFRFPTVAALARHLGEEEPPPAVPEEAERARSDLREGRERRRDRRRELARSLASEAGEPP